jgi:hypothetical protein
MEISIDTAIKLVLLETGRTNTELLPIRRKLSFHSIYLELIKSDTTKTVASNLGLSDDIIEKITSRTLYPLFPEKPKGIKWSAWLLSLIDYKKCQTCSRLLSRVEHYGSSSITWDKYAYRCKECKALDRKNFTINNPLYNSNTYALHKSEYVARAVKYNTQRSKATPPWANTKVLKAIYDNAEEDHVDHIIPLQGESVCGLHVETNLQYLSPLENIRKSNKFIPDWDAKI